VALVVAVVVMVIDNNQLIGSLEEMTLAVKRTAGETATVTAIITILTPTLKTPSCWKD
jgi:hypothetical protein